MDWKDRLIEEYEELDVRVTKLVEFIDNVDNSSKMSQDDWNMLCCQRDAMICYKGIIESRLIKLTDYFSTKE